MQKFDILSNDELDAVAGGKDGLANGGIESLINDAVGKLAGMLNVNGGTTSVSSRVRTYGPIIND